MKPLKLKNCTKKRLTCLLLLSTLAIPALSQTSWANLCGASAFSAKLPSEGSWREASTQPAQSGDFAATSAAREANIKSRAAQMEDFILNFQGHYGRGDIPPMQFIPAEGTRLNQFQTSYGEGGKITRVKVSGIGSSGILKGTLLLPVSGHNGNDNARRWAKTDKYDVRIDTVQNADPATQFRWSRTSGEKSILKDVQSLDLVTKQEVEIPLTATPGQSTTVLYYRGGSSGPAGYVEGRIIEFFWDGT